MRRLYIDFDGVVMDTIPPLYAALEKSKVDVYEEIQRRDFILIMSKKKVCFYLK